MIIANPIYDVVFKYLLEDVEIARELLSCRYELDFQGNTNDPLVKRMAERLGRAIDSEEIRDKMDVEDELERAFEREMSKKDEIIAEQEEIIAEKDKLLIKEKKRAEEEKKRTEEEIQKNLELQRQIEELKKQIKP
jgi:hypothetical protein